MIEVRAAGNAGLMAGLLDRMGQGGAAYIQLYSGTRPAASVAPSTPLIATIYLAEPAGVVDTLTGDLTLTTGVESVLLQSTAPTWARVFNGTGEQLFDCDARLSSAANTGQEIVVSTSSLMVGALLRVVSGLFSARPVTPT